MRTTVTLADDVFGAIERLRRERGIGVSEAVNELVRQGIAAPRSGVCFEQQTHHMNARIDVSDVWDAIETVDGPSAD